jgi:hypothetical protein
MPSPEKIVVRIAGFLFLLAAGFEGLGRLRHHAELHHIARWLVVAALLVVIIPIATVAAVLMYQALFARKKDQSGL